MTGASPLDASPLDLAAFLEVGRVGRAELVDRLRALAAEVVLLRPENLRLNYAVTATQKRCTELLEENRRLRGAGPDPSRGLNGPAGPSAARDPFDPLVGTTDAP